MALRQTFTKKIAGFDNDLISRDAYHKIIKITGDKANIEFIVSVSQGEQHLDSKQYSFKPAVDEASVNFIRQGYLHLKTLPEYTNSEDC